MTHAAVLKCYEVAMTNEDMGLRDERMAQALELVLAEDPSDLSVTSNLAEVFDNAGFWIQRGVVDQNHVSTASGSSIEQLREQVGEKFGFLDRSMQPA